MIFITVAMQRKPLTAVFFILWLVLFTGLSTAKANTPWGEYDWRPIKEQDGVSLATTKVFGSKFLAVKTEMIVDSDYKVC